MLSATAQQRWAWPRRRHAVDAMPNAVGVSACKTHAQQDTGLRRRFNGKLSATRLKRQLRSKQSTPAANFAATAVQQRLHSSKHCNALSPQHQPHCRPQRCLRLGLRLLVRLDTFQAPVQHRCAL